MRSLLLLSLVAIAAVSVSAISSTGAGPVTAETICDRLVQAAGRDPSSSADAYTTVQNLMVLAATGKNTVAFKGLFNTSATAPYFNGVFNYRSYGIITHPFHSQTPGETPDFTKSGSAAQNTLVAHLAQFFGAESALHCTADGYPDYSSTVTGFGNFNQYEMHANMNITQGVFNAFNSQVLAAAADKGADAADQEEVSAYLNSFGRNGHDNTNEICRMSDCVCATGYEGANCDQEINAAAGAQVSFVAMLLASVLALVAMRR